MRHGVALALLGTMTLVAALGPASADTLATVRERGEVRCGVSADTVTGFAERGPGQTWRGFDVDYCRAVAAAVFGDPEAVAFVPLSTPARLAAVADGVVDLLARNTTRNTARDAWSSLDFVAVTYSASQGFMVPRALGRKSAYELDGTQICVVEHTTSARNLSNFFAANSMSLKTVASASVEEMRSAYERGDCGAITGDLANLAAERRRRANPNKHIVLPEIVSKEPLALVVREDGAVWSDVVRWVHFTLLAA